MAIATLLMLLPITLALLALRSISATCVIVVPEASDTWGRAELTDLEAPQAP
jgi:hypothetical protein